MPTLTRQSPAKINLTLRVGPLRPDGFHEIESLVARVGLCDTVSVRPRADGQLTLECDDPAIPCDETNLALRAARLLGDKAKSKSGAHISLKKRIPAGSGLGGGSSNAATALMLLNDLRQPGLARDELAAIGAQIGSDVPLFFHSPLCIVRGRGERIEDLTVRLEAWVALVLPEIRSSTRDVYAAWDRNPSSESRIRSSELTIPKSAEALMPQLFNDLEPAALAVNPPLAEVVEQLGQLSDGPVRMTGSGAGLFRLFDSQSSAKRFAATVRAALGTRVEVVPLAAE